MNYAVVIPSLWEVDKEYARLCVKSLRDSGFGGQIILVTNGGNNPVVDIKGVSIHLHRSLQGQCGAVNEGVKAVSPGTEYVLVSNSDMYYAPGWDKHLMFDHEVFSPNLVEPTNNNGSAPPFLKADGGFTLEEFDKELVDSYIKSKLNDERAHETGFNLPFFIRKEAWDTIGGYDLEYDPWGSNSDTDLQTKINLAGITPMRLRDVLVYHFSNKTPTFTPEYQGYWQKNWDYFDKKWGFNRDKLGSDVWYNEDILPVEDELIAYRPKWKGKYANND